MSAQMLNLELDEDIAERLADLARTRKVAMAEVATEALNLFVILREQPDGVQSWSEADLVAIRRAVAQADRGELTPQSVVEREINDLLR